MIGLLQFKKALGDLKGELSEKQILELRDQQDQLAEIFFDMWLTRLNSNKKEL